MVLKARAASRSSRAPRSASWRGRISRPTLSAACARSDSGRVMLRREIQHHHQQQHQEDQVDEQVARQPRAGRHAHDAIVDRAAVGKAHRDVVPLRRVLVLGQLVRLVERYRHGDRRRCRRLESDGCRCRRPARVRHAAAA